MPIIITKDNIIIGPPDDLADLLPDPRRCQLHVAWEVGHAAYDPQTDPHEGAKGHAALADDKLMMSGFLAGWEWAEQHFENPGDK